jgi:16S rRNA (guanine1207-N2)-methyltransferase
LSEDVYFKKIIPFNFWNQNLRFKTSQDLFSSHEVDPGTRFLLRTIVEADYPPPLSILDMGCGYGPLGLTLKSLYREAEVHLVDRDALAVQYARQNTELNGLLGVESYGSLGYDDLKKTGFGLIVSNIPGKAGEPVIAYLLREAGYHLAPDGLAAVVVVTPLEPFVARTLEETSGVAITLRRTRPGHTVFHYRFIGQSGEKPSKNSLERGIYARHNGSLRFAEREFTLNTAYGLPEFDSLDYRTEMLIESFKNIQISNVERAAFFNPGQGHIPLAVWKLLQPRNISLVDRDLLSLRYSGHNLGLNGCPADQISLFHQVGIELKGHAEIPLWAGVLREEEGTEAMVETVKQAARTLSSGGLLLLSAGSTATTRLVSYLQLHKMLHIKAREKRRGYSLLVLQY